jgi:putative FmdB family regulatory protein
VPTYEYRCADCGEQLEVVQKFSDDPLRVCPVCQGGLRKVFSPVGIVFKGSGFYRTDSRKTPSGDGVKKDKEPAGATSGDSGAGDLAKSPANGSAGGDSSSGSSGSSGSSAKSGSPGKPAGKSSSSSAAPATTGS